MAELDTRQEKAATWAVLMRDVQRFEGEASISVVNSPRWNAINETLEELAAMLVEEISDSESDSLTPVTEGIWDEIRDRLIAWAVTIEQERDRRRQTIAA